jgi:DNA-binding YbaB/EbfC family protein
VPDVHVVTQAQQAAAARTGEGVAGGGMVRVEVSGTMEFRRVRIDPKVIDPADPAMLEDLVLAAIHDAAAKVAEGTQAALGQMGGGMLGGLLG